MTNTRLAIDYTNRNAHDLAEGYETISPELVDAYLLPYLPPEGKWAMDIGSGSGRDAAWLAEHGLNVMAIEPAREIREIAVRTHQSSKINWLDGELPSSLPKECFERPYDLILISAVLMFIETKQWPAVADTLEKSLIKDGILAISVALNMTDEERGATNLAPGDVFKLLETMKCEVLVEKYTEDLRPNIGYTWANFVARKT